MTRNRTVSCLTIVSLLLMLSNCREVPTSVKVESGPTFSLDGSGRLTSFRIYGQQPSHKIATPFDANSLVWRVQPTEGYLKGAEIKQLAIRYGTVPSGYTQATPNSGTAPGLVTDQIYYFFAETTDAPPAEGFFYLDGVTPIETSVPGLCQSGFVGDVKPLKCGTNELYTEPSNLEQFVRENRVQ